MLSTCQSIVLTTDLYSSFVVDEKRSWVTRLKGWSFEYQKCSGNVHQFPIWIKMLQNRKKCIWCHLLNPQNMLLYSSEPQSPYSTPRKMLQKAKNVYPLYLLNILSLPMKNASNAKNVYPAHLLNEKCLKSKKCVSGPSVKWKMPQKQKMCIGSIC